MESKDCSAGGRSSPTLDGRVLEELREFSDGELDLAEELVDLFLEDSPAQLLALQRALRSADFAEIEQRSHRLKGSAGSIGAIRFREICAALELAAKARTAVMLESAETEVLTEMEALRTALASVRRPSP